MSHTFGSWLRGDPRGCRTRHHREHVEGDYRHRPAPGTWKGLYANSKRLMKRERVRLGVDLREIVLDVIVDALIEQGVELLAATLTRDHLHLLGRFELHEPEIKLGAKKCASRHVREAGFRLDEGGPWAKGAKVDRSSIAGVS